MYAALLPAVTDCDDGESESVKSATVIVRVAAVLVSPPLSVTVSDAVRVPGVEYVTVGFWLVLPLGVPPGNVQL